MLIDSFVQIGGVTYVPLPWVLCLCLISAWIPTLYSTLYRLLRPVVYSLAKLIRRLF